MRFKSPVAIIHGMALTVAVAGLLLVSGLAIANEPNELQGRPQWEVGVGLGTFSGFDYPGSLDANRRQFGLPFFIYRSKRFRVGGGGISAVTIEEPRLKLDWSVAASLNASTEGNTARAGMEDLDFLIELGPQLILRLINSASPSGQQYRVDWSTKLRGVISTDFASAKGRGFVFESSVVGRVRNLAGRPGLTLSTGLGLRAATERLNDYFYQVDPEFVTPARRQFDAMGGLIDVRASIGLALDLPKRVKLFIGTQTGFYHHAANRDSPLHRAISSTSAAVGLVWTIAQSEERVGVLEAE